jgi:hypothetical protein
MVLILSGINGLVECFRSRLEAGCSQAWVRTKYTLVKLGCICGTGKAPALPSRLGCEYMVALNTSLFVESVQYKT